MQKSRKITIGLSLLIVGVILLGTDRVFVSADTGSFGSSMSILTIVALIFFLVGSIWLFKVAFE